MSNEHNTFALSGLKRKRDDLIKLRRRLQADIKQNDRDLKVLTEAIRLFDPIAAKAIGYVARKTPGQAIQTRRITLDALREAKGELVTARLLAERYMASAGLASTKDNQRSFYARFSNCLFNLNRAGVAVQEMIDGKTIGWRLAPEKG